MVLLILPNPDHNFKITKRCIRIVKNPEDAEVIACVLCRGYQFRKSGFGPHTVIVCDQVLVNFDLEEYSTLSTHNECWQCLLVVVLETRNWLLNVRLTALLDKKEAQLLAMNEQCKLIC
ncbi:hypothetical protein ACSBR1_014280 [Camellia fascicularis]